MDSTEEVTHFVDRREVVLGSNPASQINADKTPVEELTAVEVDDITNSGSVQGLCSSEDQGRRLGKFERSEVIVEIQGLRETTLSTSETVVNSRVRTVYGRSFSGSGSTSSTEFENTESAVDSHQETEYPVFGEYAYLDGEQRERKTSDSYYISQTYQINTEGGASTSQTAVKCVNFRSSKDFEVGSRESVSDESDLHFVDRVEEIIAGVNPEAVGSPKEKHVRFLWYDNEQDDLETQMRIQSVRESVQHMIESTYMVSDISNIVNDVHMGPNSQNLDLSRSDNSLAKNRSQFVTETGRESIGMMQSQASVETADLRLLSSSACMTTQVAYAQAQSVADTTHTSTSRSLSSSEATLALNTSYSAADDSDQLTGASAEKPAGFPTEFESFNSLTTSRGSSLALAYSPGMAIRSYALEELEEKRYRVTPDRSEDEAKSPRFNEESSGVDVDEGSSVDAVGSLAIQSTDNVSIISATSYASDSLSSQRFAVQTGKTAAQEMTREEEDESLDKLVDLASIQVGYRFHDVGIMQEYGGICNMAFDDSDENETASSSEDRTSSLQPQGAVDFGFRVSETAPGGPSQVLSRPELGTDKDSASNTRGYLSSVEYSTSFQAESAGSNTISQATSRQTSSIQQSSSFTAESVSRTSELNAEEITTTRTSYSTQVDQRKSTFQTNKSGKDHLIVSAPASRQVNQTAVESVGAPASRQVDQTAVDSVDAATSKQVNQTAVDDPDFVKELESVIEAGEKAIQKLSESLEISDLQNAKHQDNLKAAEDWSSRKEGETTQSLHVGEYQSGYTSVAGRTNVHLSLASGSTLQEKTGDLFREESEDRSSRKKAETIQSLQTRGYQSDYTRVEGRTNVNLYSANGSELQGKTVDQSRKEAELVVAYGASTVGGDVQEENVEETLLISTKGYGDSTESGVSNEAESTVRIIKGDNTERTVVANSAAFAMESPSTLYRQEVHRTEVVTSRQNDVSGPGKASFINEGNHEGVDISDNRAGLNEAEDGTVLNTADNVNITTENKETGKIVDHLQSNRNNGVFVGSRKDKNAAVGKEDKFAARVAKTEDINKVLEAVNATLASDRAAHVSDVNSKAQQAVATHRAKDVSLSPGHKKDEDQRDRSGAHAEPGQGLQLDHTGSEFVEHVIQTTVASEEVNSQTTVGVAIGGGECLRSEAVSVKETSKSKKKASKSKKKKNKEASANKETSRFEEISKERIEETSRSKETSRIEEAGSDETSIIEVSSFNETSRRAEAPVTVETSRIEESILKETSGHKEASVTKETSRTESRSKKTKHKGASKTKETSRIEDSKSEETPRVEETSTSRKTLRIEETSRNKEASVNKENSTVEDSRSKKASRNKEASVTKETSRIEESGSKETPKVKETSKIEGTSRIEETSEIKKTTSLKTVALQENKIRQPASVTRKFNVSPQFEASLKVQGATLKSESISIAVYYDTPEFTLTLSDCWLRSVNSKWQFHSGFTKLLNELTKLEYRETENKDVIISSLAALLESPLPADADSSVSMFVQKSGLREFVRYTTVYKTYSWRGMTIQLELPEYGFWVGSVTVPASYGAELHESVSIIDAFWRSTGVEALNLLAA